MAQTEIQALIKVYTAQFDGLRKTLADPHRLDLDTLLPANFDDYISKAEAIAQTLRDIKLLRALDRSF